MANVKRKNLVARFVIILLSLLASLGIWVAVAKPQPSSTGTAKSSASAAQGTTVNFGTNDNFLTPNPPQTSAGSSQYPVQRAPAPRFRTRAS